MLRRRYHDQIDCRARADTLISNICLRRLSGVGCLGTRAPCLLSKPLRAADLRPGNFARCCACIFALLCQFSQGIVQGVSEPCISGADGSAEQPRSSKRYFSNLVIVVIAGGTLTALVLQKEYWPFSHFPMYSVTIDYRKPFKTYHVYGLIEKDGNLTELLLNGSPHLGPFQRGELNQTLGYAKTTYGGRMWASTWKSLKSSISASCAAWSSSTIATLRSPGIPTPKLHLLEFASTR